MIRELIHSMRPFQWYKNLLLFIGIIFSGNIFSVEMWPKIILAFIIFSMLSGSQYIINDIIDKKKDKMHPVKRKRPIASGKVSLKVASLFSLLLILSALFMAGYMINMDTLLISMLFLMFTLMYSLRLKQIVILDVLMIAINFVLRATAGCIAIGVPMSPWIILCAMLLALFIASGKRKHELVSLGKDGNKHRKTLSQYSTGLLDQMINVSSSSLIISYSLYTFTENLWLMITIPIVIYAVFRYLFLLQTKNMGGEPEKILVGDWGIRISIVLWGLISVIILYPEIFSILGVV